MAAATRETRLFTLRMWQEETGDGQLEWRGKVQALPEGEAYYFRDWPALVAHLQAMLDAGRAEMTDPEPLEGGET
jgi:hypothetical protein